ncbi:MAG: phosphatidate cytidylyltransferase [Kiritimatiellaeota bacterium]|nr:phosphatidate cytidylyltransferase [Kiritimatiellota bacterium]
MLKYRLITGPLVLAFFVGTVLFAPVWMLVALMCGVYFLAQLEYCEMCEAGGYKLERIGIFACGFLFLGATVWETGIIASYASHFYSNWGSHSPHNPVEILFYLIPVFLIVQSVLRRKTKNAAECLGLSILGIWYVAVLMSFMVRLVLEFEVYAGDIGEGRILLIFFILLVKMGDTGAYVFGSLWGHKIKRRLIPEISPAKSIPGLLGAYVGSLLVAIIAAGIMYVFHDKVFAQYENFYHNLRGMEDLFPPVTLFILDEVYWSKAIALAVLMATAGVLGDLVESLLKRSFGVKDSSKRFPGMGGFLDILDSLLFAAPFMYFFVKWFLW